MSKTKTQGPVLADALAKAVPIAAMGREAWLAERRTGIGGTHAAAICGLSKWMTPFAAYVDLVEGHDDEEESELLYWGSALEAPILDRLSSDLGLQTVRGLFMRHPDRNWHIGSVDAVLLNKEFAPVAGADAKNTNFFMRDDWGTADAPVVPSGYEGQGRWYLPLVNVEVWWFPVLIGGHQFRKVAVHRDAATEADMLTIVDDFRRKHLEPRIPPPIDGSEAARDHLRKRFAGHTEIVREASVDEYPLIGNWQQARSALKAAEEQEALLKNQVIEAIGIDAGIKIGNEKIGLSRIAGRKTVDHKAVYAEAGVPQALIEKHTAQGAPSLRLNAPRSWNKGE